MKQDISSKVENIVSTVDKNVGNNRSDFILLADLACNFIGEDATISLLNNDAIYSFIKRTQPYLKVNHIKFIFNLAKYFNVRSVINPIGGINPFVFWNYEYKIDYYTTVNDYQILSNFNSKLTVKSLNEITNNIDLICALPPFGYKEMNSKYNLISSSLNLVLQNIEVSSIFLVAFTEGDLFSTKTRNILTKEKLHIHSILSIPSGEIDIFKINICFALISKVKPENDMVFLAKISNIEKHNEAVLLNLTSKSKSKNILDGIYLPEDKLIPLSNISISNDVDVLNRKTGYQKSSLADVMLSIKHMHKDNLCELSSNSIYFSTIGLSKVTTSVEELSEKTKKFVEIALDQSKVVNTYLMNYLNSKIGLRSREIFLMGASIQFLTNESIGKIGIILPSLTVQNEMVKLSNKIDNRRIDYDRMKHNLWLEYNSITLKAVKNELNRTEPNDKMSKWIDTLPYPLSITLWSYQSTKSIKKKVDCLLYFFESLSEFLTMMILSAYYVDKEFYSNNKSKWLNDSEDHSQWYKRATFGQWNNLFTKLSKIGREKINRNADDKNRIDQIFDYPSDDFYNIFSKEIVHTLKQTCDIRNKYKAHGGITNESTDKMILNELEKHLNILYDILNYSFEDTVFVLPIEGRKTKGIHINKVLNLSGPKTPFTEEEMVLTEMLDTDKMYMIHKNKLRATELVPFVQVKINTGASYFYSSVESSKMRWVSYHYEQEPELETDVNEDVFKPFLT